MAASLLEHGRSPACRAVMASSQSIAAVMSPAWLVPIRVYRAVKSSLRSQDPWRMSSSVAAWSVHSLAACAERGGQLPSAGQRADGLGCLHGKVGQAGEFLAGLFREARGVGPAVGDAGVPADLERVGAAGGEDEDAITSSPCTRS